MKQNLLKKWILSGMVIFLFNHLLQAQPLPPYRWATQAGSAGATITEQTQSITVDAAGNVYTTGYFSGTATFGSFSMTSAGGEDMFIAKQDVNGNYVWAYRFGGTSIDWPYKIHADAAGNLYVCGLFAGTTDFDPGPGVFNITTAGTDDIFILKLDVNGNFIWAKSVGSTQGDDGVGLAVDGSGNVIATGLFSGTVDFNPGSGTFNMTSAGDVDIFLLKLDANGNFIWARRMGNTAQDQGWAVAADVAGNVYSTGIFIGTVDFNPGTGVFNLTSLAGGGGAADRDIYIHKLDPNGNFLWAQRLGVAAADIARDIYADATGTLYATGAMNSGIYLTKINTSGTTQWTINLGSVGSGQGYGIRTDNAGNVHTSGSFAGTVDFDPGAGAVNLTSAGNSDIFISKLSPNGNYIDAYRIGGGSNDYGLALAVNASGSTVHVAGRFGGSNIDFDPGPGTAPMTGAGIAQHFTLKLSPVTLPVTLLHFNATIEGVTTMLNWATASEQNNKGFAILRSQDGSNWNSIGYTSSQAPNGNSNAEIKYTFTDPAPHAGTNFYRLQQEDLDGRISYSQISEVAFRDHTGTISLYPNPASSEAYLSGLEGGETVAIYNAGGMLVVNHRINTGGKYPLSIQGFAKGIYYVKVMSQKGRTSQFKLLID